MSTETDRPSWTVKGAWEHVGEVKCATCGQFQSDRFPACNNCCKHEEMELTEEWSGPDDGGGWELSAECSKCGKNYGFSKGDLIRRYKLVLRD